MEQIDGIKSLIFVHVILNLLPLFIKKSYFRWHYQLIDKANLSKKMSKFFRLGYNVTQKK